MLFKILSADFNTSDNLELSRRLYEEGTLSLNAENSESCFVFKYLKGAQNVFFIQVYLGERQIGNIHVNGNNINQPIGRGMTLPGQGNKALYLEDEFRSASLGRKLNGSYYRGIGQSLLAMAMGICQLRGESKISLVGDSYSYTLYEKLGFRLLFTIDDDDPCSSDNPPIEWHFTFDLIGHDLPRIGIVYIKE